MLGITFSFYMTGEIMSTIGAEVTKSKPALRDMSNPSRFMNQVGNADNITLLDPHVLSGVSLSGVVAGLHHQGQSCMVHIRPVYFSL